MNVCYNFFLINLIYLSMLIYDKLGYNKIESRYIHELLLKENRKYNENYYNEEHHNDLKGGMKTKKIIEDSSEEVESIKFVYNNHKIIFQKISYGDQIHFSLNTLDKKRECLVIILSANEIQTNKKISKCADIHQISMYDNCPLVGKMCNGGGSMLLKIGIEFIKSIKKEYNITIIQIKDNGEKFCKNKKIKLWLLNTLKNGIPWYIKYNFEPFDDINMRVNELNKVKIIANMRILNRTKTSIIEDEKLFDITDKKINEIYNKYKNKSIQYFFNEILNKNCELIENIQEIIIKKLLLFDITGISYYMKLDNNYKIQS
jgi:hypothetical protein